MSCLHGTFLVGYVRDSFSVLAADRLALVEYPTKPSEYRFDSKIVIHEKLPLAIGIAGYGGFDTSDAEDDRNLVYVKNLLSEYFLSLKLYREIKTQSLISDIGKILHPLVLKQNAHRKTLGKTSEVAATNLIIATCKWGKAEQVILGVGESVSVARASIVSPMQTCYPLSVSPMVAQMKSERLPFLLGKMIHDKDGLASHAKSIINQGIEFDRDAHEGKNKHCGGGVDVCVVDEHGARFV